MPKATLSSVALLSFMAALVCPVAAQDSPPLEPAVAETAPVTDPGVATDATQDSSEQQSLDQKKDKKDQDKKQKRAQEKERQAQRKAEREAMTDEQREAKRAERMSKREARKKAAALDWWESERHADLGLSDDQKSRLKTAYEDYHTARKPNQANRRQLQSELDQAMAARTYSQAQALVEQIITLDRGLMLLKIETMKVVVSVLTTEQIAALEQQAPRLLRSVRMRTAGRPGRNREARDKSGDSKQSGTVKADTTEPAGDG